MAVAAGISPRQLLSPRVVPATTGGTSNKQYRLRLLPPQSRYAHIEAARCDTYLSPQPGAAMEYNEHTYECAGIDDGSIQYVSEQDIIGWSTGEYPVALDTQWEQPFSTRDNLAGSNPLSVIESYGTCFGSVRVLVNCSIETNQLSITKICDVPIRFLLQLLDAPEGIREMPVLAKPSYTSEMSWFGLQSDGKFFAVFSKKIGLGFHDLLDKADVEFQAVIDLRQGEHKTEALRGSQVASMTIDINIYGHRDNAELSGNVLSSLGWYLQQPILQRSGTRYYNPHFFHIDEISETPIFELDYDISGK